MSRLALAGAFAAALLSTACSQPSLVGTWVSEGKATRTIELTPEGKARFTFEMGQSITIEGDYKLSGNRVVVTDLKLPGGLPLPAMASAMVPEKIEATYSWKNPHEIVFTGDQFLQGGYKREE